MKTEHRLLWCIPGPRMSAQAVVNVLVEHPQLFNYFQVKGGEKMNVRSGLAVRTFEIHPGTAARWTKKCRSEGTQDQVT
jgi:hypothetical protein